MTRFLRFGWIGLLTGFPASGLSRFDVDGAIEIARSQSSVERFLHHLPEHFRESYVLANRPRGNQPGHALAPRAFMFNENLITTFGACPGRVEETSPDEIEMMDLRQDKPKLMVLNFSQTRTEVRSQPTECRRCHGVETRPLWPSSLTAPRWAGMYGAGLFGVTDLESRLLAQFVAENSNHPRYSALKGLDRLTPYTRGRPDDKILSDANFEFEKVIARAVARNSLAYLVEHPNFRLAQLPLLMVLSLTAERDVPAVLDLDLARELTPLMDRPVAQISLGLREHQARLEPILKDARQSNVRFARSSLDLPDLDLTQIPVGPGPERHHRLAAALAYVAEAYGLTELESKMSTSRIPEAHAYPGFLAPVHGPAALEQMLYRRTVESAGLPDSSVGRVERSFDFQPGIAHYSSWASTEDLRRGIKRLAKALRRPYSCENGLM